MNAEAPYTLHREILLLPNWVRNSNFSEVVVPASKPQRLIERLLRSGISPAVSNHIAINSISAIANDQLTFMITNRVAALRTKQDQGFATALLSSADQRSSIHQRASQFAIFQDQSVQV